MIEDIPATVKALRYRPRVLGRSQAECLFRMSGRYETLFRASVAALTVYDMCKALSHEIVITETKLMGKTGGKRDFGSVEVDA